jgi:hypothetical protein
MEFNVFQKCQHRNNKTLLVVDGSPYSHLLQHDCHTVQQLMCIIKGAFFKMLQAKQCAKRCLGAVTADHCSTL